jgi:eukaryotic-like serine/threonine-protein kinase
MLCRPALGERFHQYIILQMIGSGGSATVFKARDTQNNRDVALKLIWHQPGFPGSNRALVEMRALQRLFAEDLSSADVIRGIKHIAFVSEMFISNGYAVIVMYLYGESLAKRLERGKLSVRSSIIKSIQITRALHLTHEHGIIHRDIKARNVLYADSGRIVLTDFGIARILDEPGVTSEGKMIGTPESMAPEQFTTGNIIDVRTDLYAVGCLLYEMIVGKPAFVSDNPTGYLRAHMQGPPANIGEHLGNVPEGVEHIIRTLLQAKSTDRFASARATEIALARVLTNLGFPEDQQFIIQDSIICPDCRGTGWREFYSCPDCYGKGYISL